jgi:hypothetical protein
VSTPSSCIFTPLGYVCKWTALGLLAWCWEKAQLHYQILGASSPQPPMAPPDTATLQEASKVSNEQGQ